MISKAAVYRAIASFRYPPDIEQSQVIEAAADSALLVVAGPGSGKTTSLTFRILKLILVDSVPPTGILATTFTVKAAAELRSRALGWGFQVIDFLLNDPKTTQKQKAFIEGIDINQVRTGTVDSLCEQLLRDYRSPGTQPPVLADEFVAKTLLLREGIFPGRRDQDIDFEPWLLSIHSDSGNRFGYHMGTKVRLAQSIRDRSLHDQLDWKKYVSGGPRSEKPARKVLDNLLMDYDAALTSRGMVDFSSLENEVLQRLRKGQLDEFCDSLEVVLVDEYQDSNLLQEQLYFELAAACDGALCVVGDDDQSLYRFRGATVNLFSDFENRYTTRFGNKPRKLFLSTNYRSTKNIISFVDDYANLDTGYQSVRVGGKPTLQPGPTADEGMPILGMFRDTVDELAEDLAKLVHDVSRGKGYVIPLVGTIQRDTKGGDVGDIALLCSSPADYSSGNKARLPLLLRDELAKYTKPIQVFNPRGQNLTLIKLVEIFGGLLLECIDCGGVIQGDTSGVGQGEKDVFDRWRDVAVDFVNDPSAPTSLQDYAIGWVDRDPDRTGFEWPRSVAIIDLIYGLLHYLPDLHDDPEGQVYLEVFTRQLGACEQVGKFKGRLVHDPANSGLSEASIKELLRDFLAPIASGTIQVDEELVEAFPRDRLSILSIHQSKGLEFPLTIVDVGADFKTNHRAHRFKRHPISGGPAHRLEDELRRASPLGIAKRSQQDRAFDDLYRQFFVAFSRAEDVLLLVGVRPTFPGNNVPNVATGWDRDEVCHWEGKDLPFIAI